MKMVAAAKLRRAQTNITQMRPYAAMLQNILQNLSANMDQEIFSSPYIQERSPDKVLIIAISSDRGLCGAFNSNIIKATRRLLDETYAPQVAQGQVSILPIGNKVYDYFRKRDYPLVEDYRGVLQQLSFSTVKTAAEYVLKAFVAGTYDKVEIVYTEFRNVITQVVQVEQMLPVVPTQPEEGVANNSSVDYILEPSQEEIITELIPKILKMQLYRAVLDSNASEYGARMTAMDKATDNAAALIKELQLIYNRARQAAITKEILEIVGGAEALNAE